MVLPVSVLTKIFAPGGDYDYNDDDKDNDDDVDDGDHQLKLLRGAVDLEEFLPRPGSWH